MNKEKTKKMIGFMADKSYVDKINGYCKSSGTTKAEYIRSALHLRESMEINGPEITLICSEAAEVLRQNANTLNKVDYDKLNSFIDQMMGLMREDDK